MYDDILRYMGHMGDVSGQLEELISICLKKLSSVCTPRYVIKKFPCIVIGDSIKLDTVLIKSSALASRLCGCSQVFMFAATLGADVDRLIAQRVKIDSSQALCLQACAAAKIEEYCDNIEKEISHNASKEGLFLRSRFSPGYDDFDIMYQTDILCMLNAQKTAGITETKSHMLSPLKSVTAIIGLSDSNTGKKNKCEECGKKDCHLSLFQNSVSFETSSLKG